MKVCSFLVALVLLFSVANRSSVAEENSVDFLLGTQNPDGGWGTSQGSRSTVADTSIALMALLRSGENFKSSSNAQKMRLAKKYLTSRIMESNDNDLTVKDSSPLIASKLGPNKDLFFATWALAESLESPLSSKEKKVVRRAIEKAMKKIRANLIPSSKSSGVRSQYFGGALGAAVELRAIERAISAGVLPESKLKQFLMNLDPESIQANSNYALYDEASKISIQYDLEMIKGMLKGRRERPAPSKELEAAIRSLDNFSTKSQFIQGFGSLGGEEMLSYQLISDALAVGGVDQFNKWQQHITGVIDAAKNPDGSIVGKHCITGTTFPTAAGILTKTAGKAPDDAKKLPLKVAINESHPNIEDVNSRIDKYRDAKGKKNTQLLAQLIQELNGAEKQKARKALVQRMCRMNAKTLRKKLSSADAEIQFAAIKSIVKKQKVELLPELISLLTSDNNNICKEAVDALRSFSDNDFGYDPEGSHLSKRAVQKRWQKWWSDR